MNDTRDPQNAPVDVPNLARVQLRVAVDSDEEFLLKLFASTRSDELAALAWNPAQAELFATMQYGIQRQNYKTLYPNARNEIILLDEQPIGRMLIDRSGNDFLLVDIALLPEHRNQGIGGALIKNLLQEAASLFKPVVLQVFSYNPACHLYERLGFSKTSEENAYIEMKWNKPD